MHTLQLPSQRKEHATMGKYAAIFTAAFILHVDAERCKMLLRDSIHHLQSCSNVQESQGHLNQSGKPTL